MPATVAADLHLYPPVHPGARLPTRNVLNAGCHAPLILGIDTVVDLGGGRYGGVKLLHGTSEKGRLCRCASEWLRSDFEN